MGPARAAQSLGPGAAQAPAHHANLHRAVCPGPGDKRTTAVPLAGIGAPRPRADLQGRIDADTVLAYGLILTVFSVMIMGLAVNWMAARANLRSTAGAGGGKLEEERRASGCAREAARPSVCS